MRNLRERGYTLTEMMIVVALVALVAPTMMPNSAPQGRVKVDAAVAEITGALNFARGEAMRTGQFHGVNISATQNRIRVYKLNMATMPPSEDYTVYHPLDKKLYDVSLSSVQSTASAAVTLSDFKFAGSPVADSVTFNSFGAPVKVLSATSSAQLLADSKAIVSSDSYSREAWVSPETGRITKL